MLGDVYLRERLWRAAALALFTVVAWQAGSAALAPPAPPAADATAPGPASAISAPPDLAAEPAPPLLVEHTAPALAALTPPPHHAPPPPSPPLRVGNTGGIGVYLRATPRLADRLRAWPDGTPMLPTGRETEAEGRRWREVRDPTGTIGWIPASYLVP
jgi:hypothetical protein